MGKTDDHWPRQSCLTDSINTVDLVGRHSGASNEVIMGTLTRLHMP